MSLKIGFDISTEDVESLVPSKAELSIVGAIVTAPNKDASLAFNTPYAVNSDDADFYTKLGATGTGRAAMTGAAKQLGQLQTAVRMVIVIVDAGANAAATIANMVGNPALKTGVHAFKKAGQQIARIPRILIAPEFTSQMSVGAVLSAAVNAGGSGYTNGAAVTASGGGGSGFAATAIVTAGAVTGLNITNRGSGYTTPPTLTVAGGTGATFQGVTVGNLGNAVCAELASVCESLLATSVVVGPASTRQAAIDWRETLASKRLIPVETDVIVSDAGGNPVTVDSAPHVAGLINRVDDLHEGYPFHSAGNRELYGVLGPSRYIDFSLTEDATEGQELLQNDLGIIIRGEAGDDFAIAEGGTLFLGVSTASNEELWQYYSQVRGRDWIHLTLLRTLRQLLAKHNLTARLVQVYVNAIRDVLTRLAADERIHKAFQVEFVPSLNTPQDLRAGQLTVKMAVEEPAPFLKGVIKSNRYEFALTSFVGELEAQINQIAL